MQLQSYRYYGTVGPRGEDSTPGFDDDYHCISRFIEDETPISRLEQRRAATSAVGDEYFVSISTPSPTKMSPASPVAQTEVDEGSGFDSSSQSQDVVDGFAREDSDPTMETSHLSSRRNSTRADIRLSMVSNFSAAYNTLNVSLALALMRSVHPPSAASDVATCTSALIAGMILGQLGGGLLGDWLGRHAAMAVAMTLQVGAALASALTGSAVAFGGEGGVYAALAFWRFLLGAGCGAVYPLAAAIAAESSAEADTGERERSVALSFSMQGVGYLAVPLIAYALVILLGEESDLAWRLLLGAGALPGLALIGIRIHRRSKASRALFTPGTTLLPHQRQVQSSPRSIEGGPHVVRANGMESLTGFKKKSTPGQIRLKPKSLFEQIRNEPNLSEKLIGTAGCWFLFDILFYGNNLFQPVVLSAAFGESETTVALVRDSIFISLMALPGYFVSVVMVRRQSPKSTQLQGFLCMAILYATIGAKFDSLYRLSLLGLYGLTFFFSNFGPNSTTFMLPSMTFSRPCRSTLNGACAACGKLGALFGSSIFIPLASWSGTAHVMILCSVVAVIAAVTTLAFTDDSTAMSDILPQDANEVDRISSEHHLASLQYDEIPVSRSLPETVIKKSSIPVVLSMPNFLDLQ